MKSKTLENLLAHETGRHSEMVARFQLLRDSNLLSKARGRAIWLYLRFTLSLRDVEDLLAERGIMVFLRDCSALGESFWAHDRGGSGMISGGKR